MRNSPVILQIGLVRYEPAWEMLLRQIGVPFNVVSENDSLQSEYSVIIVNADIGPVLQSAVDEFALRGGAVLYTPSAVQEIRDRAITSEFVRSLPPATKEHYQYYNVLDLYSHVTYFRNDDFIETERSGDGWKVFFGVDVGIILSSGATRKNFYRRSGRMPNEVVAKRSKGPLRQLIFSVLKTLHHLQGIPFVHQWYYPGYEQTLFTMRIDSDKGSQNQIEPIYRISEEHSIPTSWFLDVKSHESWLPYFRKFGRQEIGVHCYEHVFHRSALLNKENFAKALSLLRQNGLDPKGITAPTGEWNKGYSEAIESLGFQYSSEFAFDYDNLPSFPYIGNAFSPLPQIPVHPACIGTMLRARMEDDEMISHFRSVIDTHCLLNEPICFYHHPTHGHNGVFEEVFRYINERKIAKLSYGHFADWWKYRAANNGLLRYSGRGIESVSGYQDIHHRIIRTDNSESIAAIQGTIDFDNITFKQIKREIVRHDDILRSRSFDPLHVLHNFLDWWIKTTE